MYYRRLVCRIVGLSIALGLGTTLLFGCGYETVEKDIGIMDMSSVHLMVDLMQKLVARNPNYEQSAAALDLLDGSERQQNVDSLVAFNAADPTIDLILDSLLGSTAYQLYYRQFKNVTPELHRRVLLALPVASIRSPADISRNLRSICLNIDSVQTWVADITTGVDLDRCRRIALQWLPEGEYHLPTVHFIMDGNGDAFAREGEVCFDLYSLLLSPRPEKSRYSNLGAINTNEVEIVLAHEFHHIYAAQFLYSLRDLSDWSWTDRFRNRLIRRMVSEGVAMRCNPPTGLARTIKEDTAVVRYWIGQLNDKLAALETDTLSQEAAEQWLRDSYHRDARQLLTEYFRRDYEGDELRAMVAEHIVNRPTMIYTLGWWMISRINQTAGRDQVIALLSDPGQLFDHYNAAVEGAPDYLKIQSD